MQITHEEIMEELAEQFRPILDHSGLRKDGTTFAAETDMIPISWRGHAVAYHFVRQL